MEENHFCNDLGNHFNEINKKTYYQTINTSTMDTTTQQR
jgi:hypothetical protein